MTKSSNRKRTYVRTYVDDKGTAWEVHSDTMPLSLLNDTAAICQWLDERGIPFNRARPDLVADYIRACVKAVAERDSN